MKKRLLIGFAIVPLVLLLGVLLYKPALFYLFRVAHDYLFESALITRPDPRFGMDLLPNVKRARLVAPARPHTTHEAQDPRLRKQIKRRLEFYTDTNAHAFRGPEVPLDRSTGSFRMVFLGDSITFGWGVPEEESYAGFVRRMLPPLMPGRTVEVINGGIPGFPLVQIPSLLRHKIAPFKPDVVCVMKYGMATGQTNALDDFRQHLHRVHEEARAMGAKLLLTVPPISSFDTVALSWKFGEVLSEVGRELQVPTINFGPIFKQAGEGRGLKLEREGTTQRLVRYRDGQREVVLTAKADDEFAVARAIYDYLDETEESEALFLDGGHPDLEGNQLIAKHIVETLKAQGWLEAGPP